MQVFPIATIAKTPCISFIAAQWLTALLLGLSFAITNALSGQNLISTHNGFHISGFIYLEGTNKPAILAKITFKNGDKTLYTSGTDAQGKYSLEADSNLIPHLCHIIIESNDNRVRYEEDIEKSQLLAGITRSIPFYRYNIEKTAEQTAAARSTAERQRWFSKKKPAQPKHFRPLICPEF